MTARYIASFTVSVTVFVEGAVVFKLCWNINFFVIVICCSHERVCNM